MVCVPAVRLAVLYVAVPEPPRVPMPRTLGPSLKVTVPVGTPGFIAGRTVAVKVTFAPRFAVVEEDTTAVVVAIIVTEMDRRPEVDGAKFVSPLYCAAIESVPTGRAVASVATPEAFNI